MPPSRYSEDLDLVQVEPEPIGPVLRRLSSWLIMPKAPRAGPRDASGA